MPIVFLILLQLHKRLENQQISGKATLWKVKVSFKSALAPLWLALENLEIIRGMIECWRLKSDKLLQVVCNFSPVNKTNGSADLSQINHGNDNNRPKVWIMLCSIVFPLLCYTTELEPGLLDTDFFTRLIKIDNIFLILSF